MPVNTDGLRCAWNWSGRTLSCRHAKREEKILADGRLVIEIYWRRFDINGIMEAEAEEEEAEEQDSR